MTCNPCTLNCNQGRQCPQRQTMNERTAFAAMDEQAEWASRNVIAMRRAMPKRHELHTYCVEGPYKRERKNHRLGALILLVSAITVLCLIRWLIS